MCASPISGYVLYHKKTGVTSFGALSIVKKALNTGKVGHTGTLDKFASGLLVLLAGRALKLAPLFESCDKQYEGIVKFGAETDTLDPEGAVVTEAPLPSQEAIEAALPLFRGDILQTPPAYSALHIGGERASALARSGEIPDMKPRPVSIHALSLRSYDPPFAEIAVHCSKGVYIRSLARDIARAAGSRAHLHALTRTRVAGFHLENAAAEDDFLALGENAPPPDFLQKIQTVDTTMFDNLGIPFITADAETARDMAHGKPLGAVLQGLPLPQDADTLGVFDDAGRFIAFLKNQDRGWKYGYVYALA